MPVVEAASQSLPEGPRSQQSTVPVADGTPRLSPTVEWFTRVVALVCVAYSVYYIAWRWTSTLNLHFWWISIPLALAETWGVVTFAVLAHTAWRLKLRSPAPPTRPCTVDVFVTTYDEPVELLRRTVAGAKGITYPHTTYILDDGRREDVKTLAQELGVGYISRETNEHAKAGNLNNALQHTDGEFILQLDADHVPLPHILDRLLGFFDDEGVAFVQTPQDFYNTDSFSHSVNRGRRRIFEEQRLFFLLIQPGKDRTNSAFFCGSCGVIRRQALAEIGGFSTETITEDMDTAILLHARGWKSAYYGESLAYGLAPGSAHAFQVQRLRWGQGSMQILRKRNLLRMPGLTWQQRLNYLSSTMVYFDGLFYLVLYLAPIVFFALGAFPLQVASSVFLKRFIPYIALTFVGGMLLTRGTNSPWRAAVYGMAKFPIYILALSALFRSKSLSFKVTPKGATGVPFQVYAPQLSLLVVSITAFLWSVIAGGNGWINYRESGWGTVGWTLNLVWLVFNAAAAAAALRMALGTKQRRADYRFPERLPVDFASADLPVAIAVQGVTSNLNATGMLLRTTEKLPAGARYRFNIPLRMGLVEVTGTIVSVQPLPVAGLPLTAYGIQFDLLNNAAAAAIDLHCSQHVVPKEFMRYRVRHPTLERAAEWLANVRRSRREFLDLPVRVHVQGADGIRDLGVAILEDYSARGFSVLVEQPVAPGSIIELQLPYFTESAAGIAVSCRGLETPHGEQFVVGASCVDKQLPLPAPEPNALRLVRKFENWIAA